MTEGSEGNHREAASELSIASIAAACKARGSTTLCKLLEDAKQRDKAKYKSTLRKLLEEVDLVLISAHSIREHVGDTLSYMRRFGLLPWGCDRRVAGELVQKGRRGGARKSRWFHELVDTVVGGATTLWLLHSGGKLVAIGVPVVVAGYLLAPPLWDLERKGAGEWPARWFSVPLLVCSDVECRLEDRLEAELRGFRSCIQPVRELKQEIVEGVKKLLLEDRIGDSMNLLSELLQCVTSSPAITIHGSNRRQVEADEWQECTLGEGSSLLSLFADLATISNKLLARGNLLLEGPPGVGKTSVLVELARACNVKLLFATASADWSRGELIGTPVLSGGSISWRSGWLVRAAAAAANGERVLLLIDEVSRCDVDKVFAEFFSIFRGPHPTEWDATPLCEALDDAKHRFANLDADAEKLLDFCKDAEYLTKLIRGRLRVAVTLNSADAATTFLVGQAFLRRFYRVTVLPPASEEQVEREVASAARLLGLQLSEDELNRLAKFIAKLRRGIARALGLLLSPIPVGAAATIQLLRLHYEAKLGLEEAICSVYAPTVVASNPHCSTVVGALEEAAKELGVERIDCGVRCAAGELL